MSLNDECYVMSNKETAVAVLRIIRGERDDSGPIATHWMNKAVPPTRARNVLSHQPSTERTRRFLHKLRGAGLVDGDVGRDGKVRWWRITDDGRAWLARQENRA